MKGLADVLQPYKAQNATIPLGLRLSLVRAGFNSRDYFAGFIIQRVDKDSEVNQTCAEASVTFKALLAAGFTHNDLFQTYHAICTSVCRWFCRLPCNLFERYPCRYLR